MWVSQCNCVLTESTFTSLVLAQCPKITYRITKDHMRFGFEPMMAHVIFSLNPIYYLM
jgi:hypothetical protein